MCSDCSWRYYCCFKSNFFFSVYFQIRKYQISILIYLLFVHKRSNLLIFFFLKTRFRKRWPTTRPLSTTTSTIPLTSLRCVLNAHWPEATVKALHVWPTKQYIWIFIFFSRFPYTLLVWFYICLICIIHSTTIGLFSVWLVSSPMQQSIDPQPSTRATLVQLAALLTLNK